MCAVCWWSGKVNKFAFHSLFSLFTSQIEDTRNSIQNIIHADIAKKNEKKKKMKLGQFKAHPFGSSVIPHDHSSVVCRSSQFNHTECNICCGCCQELQMMNSILTCHVTLGVDTTAPFSPTYNRVVNIFLHHLTLDVYYGLVCAPCVHRKQMNCV